MNVSPDVYAQWLANARQRRKNASDVRAFRRLVAGSIFGATFVKADGSVRRGVFRADAKRRDGSGSRHFGRNRQVVVWDMRQRDYRVITLDRLLSIRINGQEITL